MNKINIALIGFGNIGSGVVKILRAKNNYLSKRLGAELNLKYVCDKDIITSRGVKVDAQALTTDFNKALNDAEVQIVIELVGGTSVAKEIVLQAVRNKKHVITANKALLAEHGEELFAAAAENNVRIFFEAAVGGGIPIIRAIQDSLVANQIKYVYAIINGTSNYILSQMAELKRDFKSALVDAQNKRYAEKDPTLDIDGIDSAHKIAILTKLCFGRFVTMKDIYIEGIRQISLSDVRNAEELGFCVKLLAIAKKEGQELEVRVHPTLLPRGHMLSSVNGVFNAIHLAGDLVGDMLFYGRGAGQLPTSSAIIGDLNDAVAILNNPLPQVHDLSDQKIKRVRDIREITSRYYLRLTTLDEPGVLAQIANILGKYRISISSVLQKGKQRAKIVPIVMMTHKVAEKDLQDAVAELDKLEVIKRKTIFIRVEEG